MVPLTWSSRKSKVPGIRTGATSPCVGWRDGLDLDEGSTHVGKYSPEAHNTVVQTTPTIIKVIL